MVDSLFQQTLVLGSDSGHGNLLGIQPYMIASDYTSSEALFNRLDGYFCEAAQKGWLGERSVVVLPEYCGAWLTTVGEHAGVHQAKTITAAIAAMAFSRLPSFALAMMKSTEQDRLTAASFHLKAIPAARAYTTVFSALARKFKTTIAAGTIILPDPRIENGAVVPGNGKLYNTCVVFGPDGFAHPQLTRKAFPVADELPFITPGPVAEIPAYETPIGRLGVLICADSWYPESYVRMKELNVDFVAVPSYLTGPDTVWENPWRSYSGAGYVPADVDPADTGRLTEGQAWRKYSLGGRLQTAGTSRAMNVFLHGGMWELGGNGGKSLMMADGQSVESDVTGAALLNLWL